MLDALQTSYLILTTQRSNAVPPTMIGTQVCITQRYIFYFLLKEKFFFINCVHCFLKWIISFPTCIHSKTEIYLNRSYICMHSDVSSMQPSVSILWSIYIEAEHTQTAQSKQWLFPKTVLIQE